MDASQSRIQLVWREVNGPPVTPPTHTGLGTRLMTKTLEAAFGGTVELNFNPAGVVLTLSAPR